METGVSVYMRLDCTMTRMLTEIEESYKTYVDQKSSLVVRLDKVYMDVSSQLCCGMTTCHSHSQKWDI